MKDRVSHLNHEYINLIGVEVRREVITIKEDTKAGLGPITHIEVNQDTIKILEAG